MIARSLLVAFIAALFSARADAAQSSMTLLVDESQAPRRIAFVREDIPVNPGPLTLAYPKWIPGEHGPTGPIADFSALRITSGRTPLRWKRDPDDPYLVNLDIPAGTSTISVSFNTLFESTISESQARVDWNTVILYPRSSDKRTLMVTPSLIVPDGWKEASALHEAARNGARIDFEPISLERLVDSPVITAELLRVVPLQSIWPAELDITADTQAALDRTNDAHAFGLFTKLLDQDRAMFGYRHFDRFHILITQSDADPFDGLEHEESPYNAVGGEDLSKKDMLEQWGGWLLAHEQSHSWDGKYRRPAELYSKTDYQGPERTSLLWVYEGLNEYIGYVLATRAGFSDQEYMRDHLASAASIYSRQAARKTTPLVDTAAEAWILRSPPNEGWYSYRRSQDYYEEGMLYWLGADAIIRRESHGRRSLDDFLKAFFGQRDTGPIVVPYTREDVETALNAVQPYDWHDYIERRIYQINPNPPTDGIEAAGWRLTYTKKSGAKYFGRRGYDANDSLGMQLSTRGEINDVVPGMPADAAGLGPQMTILAVDGRAFSTDALEDAIAHPRAGTITLIVKNFDNVQTVTVHYAGGLKYPHLERIPDTADYLTAILKPKKT